jgi:hypothetical protein
VSPIQTEVKQKPRLRESRLLEKFNIQVVQPKKECGNYEYGEKYENENSPPAEHYVMAHGTPIGGMADSLAAIAAVSFRPVVHYYPAYITNPVVCAKQKRRD